MALTTTQPNLECCTGLHTEHLCYMVSQGFHVSDEQEYEALVENARYQCNRCERVAASDANLCVPVPL
ncbi:MAG: hypothetical protein H8E73_04835 [Planctomycetes bacterium]|nr:hypothetical protein [Planctomycetota bacterium]MBL7187787.1 hypothetical protein [Phycisphaerae bacterium]